MARRKTYSGKVRLKSGHYAKRCTTDQRRNTKSNRWVKTKRARAISKPAPKTRQRRSRQYNYSKPTAHQNRSRRGKSISKPTKRPTEDVSSLLREEIRLCKKLEQITTMQQDCDARHDHRQSVQDVKKNISLLQRQIRNELRRKW